MSDIKEKLTVQVEKINETITDAKEKAIVMDEVQNMINVFTEHVVKLTERQVEVESRVEEILDMLSSLEDEMIEKLVANKIDISPYFEHLTEDIVKKLHNAGLVVNPWLVNEVPNVEILDRWGVEMITSNFIE